MLKKKSIYFNKHTTNKNRIEKVYICTIDSECITTKDKEKVTFISKDIKITSNFHVIYDE